MVSFRALATCLALTVAALMPHLASTFSLATSLSLSPRSLRGGGAAGLCMASSMADRIQDKLSKLNPTRLVVTDDSHKHAGHAGVGGRSGETHYSVDIVSEEFKGMRLVQRHQKIYALLQDEMDLQNTGTGIHALQINAKAPGEP